MATKLSLGWTLKVPINMAMLRSLYQSRGDVTISTPTVLSTTLDGPMQVFSYNSLVVNAALTFQYRNRGNVILSKSRSMGAAGSISVAGMGAAGSSKWVNQDIVIPSYIVLTGDKTSPRDFFKWLKKSGYFLLDPNLFANPLPGMGDVQADYASWPGRGTAIISAAGCGAAVMIVNGWSGPAGNAGSHAPGSGGCAPAYAGTSASGKGNVWGGGGGANPGWSSYPQLTADQYGGYVANTSGYGTAGWPGGGVLIDICDGPFSVASGHVFTAAGVNSTAANTIGAGASAGGFVGIYCSGTFTGSPNIIVSGGIGAASTYTGGNGGIGYAEVTTLAAKGIS